MAEKVEISRTQLWGIAKKITELQKKAYETPDKDKGNIAWQSLEEEWFDYLEEELIKPEINDEPFFGQELTS